MSRGTTMTEADAEPYTARTTRPALDVLDHDQDRLLYRGDTSRDPPIRALSDGFRTYREALFWYQAAGVRTLGHVEDVIEPRHMLPISDVFEHLIAERGQVSEYARMRVVEALNDACDLAYREFRERANERVEDSEATSWKDVDPESEQNPLMRPAFQRLDRSQAGALLQLWNGFENRQAIGRWVRSLTVPTHGETPERFLDMIVSSPVLLESLLDQEGDDAKRIRYRFAVNELLPPFLAAARSLTGSERTDSSGSPHGAWNS
ncbi:hypothetical protein DM2_2150 [Halorubrum sp. DM2]|nr:hypothetical protein DM2_2150 [Halorubrum sp. DM2]